MAWYDGVRTGIRVPSLLGGLVLLVGLGGFGTWAAVAPLEGAVIAPGTVTTLGRNKFIQHLEGGIVREVLVDEGDLVTKGQPLVLLDPTTALATRNRLRSQIDTLAALEARALAESSGAGEIAFPAELLQSDDPNIAAAIEDQTAEFEARLRRFENEHGILGEQVSSLEQEMVGLEAQRDAVRMQLDILAETMPDLEALLENDLVVKARVLDARSREAELIGHEGQITATLAKAQLMIGEKEYEQQRLSNVRLEEASRILVDARSERADLLEQLQAAEDALARTTVVAPEAGTVANIAQLGPGSVVTPGQRIMEILPYGTDLIVEARIMPHDVDQVFVGQQARLVFAALDPRSTPQVNGSVSYLSVDSLEDERTGMAYYLARLVISNEPVPGFDPSDVGAGQPVEVYITTGERTFLNYLLDPIMASMRRSMRE